MYMSTIIPRNLLGKVHTTHTEQTTQHTYPHNMHVLILGAGITLRDYPEGLSGRALQTQDVSMSRPLISRDPITTRAGG